MTLTYWKVSYDLDEVKAVEAHEEVDLGVYFITREEAVAYRLEQLKRGLFHAEEAVKRYEVRLAAFKEKA